MTSGRPRRAPLRAFQVGIVGARRVREGTGPYLAAHIAATGCKVVGVAGQTLAGATEAARDLALHHGLAATAYPSAQALVREAGLDALVIASPDPTHEDLLRLALDARLHVLVEKPLVWSEGDGDAGAGSGGSVPRGAALVEAFAAADLCLVTNLQWRHALPAYMRLFPDVAPRRASRFEMSLSPSVAGLAAVPAAMPHPLSVLDHLFPPSRPGLHDLQVSGTPDALEIAFRHPGRDVACLVRLRTTTARPRPASFGFDGSIAHRRVAEPGYRFSLNTADGARSVPLPDPTAAVVNDFVARVRRGPPFPPEPFAVPGLVHLSQVARDVAAAAARWPFAPPPAAD